METQEKVDLLEGKVEMIHGRWFAILFTGAGMFKVQVLGESFDNRSCAEHWLKAKLA